MNEAKRKALIESIQSFKYEKSRHLMDFHIAGFAYYEGLDVIDALTLGKTIMAKFMCKSRLPLQKPTTLSWGRPQPTEKEERFLCRLRTRLVP